MEFCLLAPGIAGGDKDQTRTIAARIARIYIAAGCLAEARLAEFRKDSRQAQRPSADRTGE
jgi:hypothetical protein